MKKDWLQQVHKEAERIFRAQLDLALGQYREVKGAEGVIRVYKQPPNARAIGKSPKFRTRFLDFAVSGLDGFRRRRQPSFSVPVSA